MKRELISSIFSKIPTLSTDRFILRQMSVDDSDDMFEYAKDAEVTKYLTWSPHANKGFTFEYLTYLYSENAAADC